MKPKMHRGRSDLTRAAAAFALAFLIAGVLPSARGQQQDAAQPTLRNPSIIRMSVDLVQIDAIVTDRLGRHVTDLTPADFEVLQDGRPQTISTFLYVPGETGGASAASGDGGQVLHSGSTPTIAAIQPPRRDQVRRTMAIIVDDLSLSFESIARVRNALRRFIDEQMGPGDLVAILRTGAGMGALQQFTTDRRLLHAAVDRVRWNMQARVAPFEAATGIDTRTEPIEKELATASTLGAIRYVIRGIAQLPGRKSVLLLSDGFRLTDADGRYGRVVDMLRSVADASHRAGVVLYGVDLRGLATASPTAADGNEPSPAALLESRMLELSATQDGIGALANETGGLFIKNTNDIGGALQKVLDDQRGYYLLGYVPQGSTFSARNPRFHSLAVRVKRQDLRVRSRRGFLGRPEPAVVAGEAANRLVAAVTSPFAGGDIRLRLSSFFGHVEKIGPIVLSVMHVDARDLAFTERPDGTRTATLELLAMTFGENGQVADQHSRRYTVTLGAERYAQALRAGFVYSMRVPVKQPGPYQLRVALRETTSDRIGSASQFIEVPNIRNNRLTLSGLLIQGTEAANPADGTVADSDPNATVAVRRFRQGTSASYFCSVYNARRGARGQPQIGSEIRLFRDGVLVFESEPRPIASMPGSTEFAATGVLQLGAAIPPGSYVLELTVTDRLAKRSARATQTIDFEVIGSARE